MGNQGIVIFYLSVVFLILVWIWVGLRLYVRIGIKRAFGADDWFLIASLIFASCHFIIPLVEPQCLVKAGHQSPTVLENNIRCYFVAQLFYVVATGMVKISFSLTLYRLLFADWKQWFVYGIILATSIITIFYFFWLVFDCNPVQYYWTRVKHPDAGTCMSMSLYITGVYAHGFIILFSDLALAILPVLMIKDLNMDWKTKLSAMGVLAIGSVPTIATIVRITSIHKLNHVHGVTDFLAVGFGFIIWTIIEIGTSIIAVSATALRPLGEKLRLLPTYFTSWSERTTDRNSLDEGFQLQLSNRSGSASTEAIVGLGPEQSGPNKRAQPEVQWWEALH